MTSSSATAPIRTLRLLRPMEFECPGQASPSVLEFADVNADGHVELIAGGPDYVAIFTWHQRGPVALCTGLETVTSLCCGRIHGSPRPRNVVAVTAEGVLHVMDFSAAPGGPVPPFSSSRYIPADSTPPVLVTPVASYPLRLNASAAALTDAGSEGQTDVVIATTTGYIDVYSLSLSESVTARIRYKRRVTLSGAVRAISVGRDSWGRAMVLAAQRDGFAFVSQKGTIEQTVRTNSAVSAASFPAHGLVSAQDQAAAFAIGMAEGGLRVQQRAKVTQYDVPGPIHAVCALPLQPDAPVVFLCVGFDGTLHIADQARALAVAPLGEPLTCAAAALLPCGDGHVPLLACGRLGDGIGVWEVPRSAPLQPLLDDCTPRALFPPVLLRLGMACVSLGGRSGLLPALCGSALSRTDPGAWRGGAVAMSAELRHALLHQVDAALLDSRLAALRTLLAAHQRSASAEPVAR